MHSFPALPAIAFLAEHLAVFGDGAATEVPRRDVVGFHLGKLEMLSTVGAETHLTFVSRKFLRISEGTNGQMLLLTSEDVRINTRLLGHVIIEDEALYLFIDLVVVDYYVFVLFVKHPPPHAFHNLLSFLGRAERSVDPGDDRLEELPQRRSVHIVLMVRHVKLDVAVRDPVDGGLQIILANG